MEQKNWKPRARLVAKKLERSAAREEAMERRERTKNRPPVTITTKTYRSSGKKIDSAIST